MQFRKHKQEQASGESMGRAVFMGKEPKAGKFDQNPIRKFTDLRMRRGSWRMLLSLDFMQMSPLRKLVLQFRFSEGACVIFCISHPPVVPFD